MRHVISIHHLYQTGLNVKDLYSIPDLSVAHWFRLRRNTLLDGSQVFLLSLFFLPSYTNVSHMETPPGCISSWYSILQLRHLCTQKTDCTTFIKNDTPTVYTSSSQLHCF